MDNLMTAFSFVLPTKIVYGPGSIAKLKQELVDAGVKDTLESKFQTEIIDKYSPMEQYNDTLFFMPVNNALLDLTNYKA